MNATVFAEHFGGTIPAIPSKSFAHRLLICAALSEKPTALICPGASDDILTTAKCLNTLGAVIRRTDMGFGVVPIKKETLPEYARLDCGESGSTARFMLPLLCALGVPGELIMHGRLAKRPMSPLYEELVRNGIKLSEQGVSPLRVSGRLQGNDFAIAADVSSQFISGLMMALPALDGGSVALQGRVESGSYIDVTSRCLETAGVGVFPAEDTISVYGKYDLSGTVTVEGDWSNAAFWLVAGTIGPEPVTVTGLNPNSVQGDRKIVDIIEKFGGEVMVMDDAVIALPSTLTAADVDASDIPDLVPIITVLAACAKGTTKIYNAGRLRLKESDRLAAIEDVMSTLSVDITKTPDGLTIRGGRPMSGGRVSAWNDHRIAMTAAVASIATLGTVTIQGAECVSKSYPKFFADFKRLGGLSDI